MAVRTHDEDERLRTLFAQSVGDPLRAVRDREVIQSLVGDVKTEKGEALLVCVDLGLCRHSSKGARTRGGEARQRQRPQAPQVRGRRTASSERTSCNAASVIGARSVHA